MLATLLEKQWHLLSLPEVLTLLETDAEQGLDAFEVVHRQKQFGPNSLALQEGTSSVLLFLLQFHQPLVYILLAATLITALLHEWVDSGVIFGVVLINAVIGYTQESKALQAIAALARTMDGMTTVIRAGHKQRLSCSALVPGDLVVLQSGDKVPADLRLVNERNLQIDESALTGESIPVLKQVHVLPQETVLSDRSNMAFSSSLVTAGGGLGVVVATGDATEMGRIKRLIESADVLETPLTQKIKKFSGMLLWVILGLAGMTFLVGWLRGEAAFDMFMAAVALAVGAIPEALPAAMTIMLAIGVSRMARRHAIVRKLPAVEILGSTTVICSDKTGTLTQNQMTVQEVFAGYDVFSFLGLGYSPVGEIHCQGMAVDPELYPALLECVKAGLLCNDSQLVAKDGSWHVEGDPTEGALLVAALKSGLSVNLIPQQFPRVDTIPFESQEQFMATLHDQPDNVKKIMYVKGAVERIIPRCARGSASHGQLVDVDAEVIQHTVQEMTEKGLRVLAFAFKSIPADQCSIVYDDVGELVFLGLQGMMDPPRPEAIPAVQACHSAGIHVKMITGDHVGTAVAIAKQMRLAPSGHGLHVLSGHDIARFTDAELIKQVEQVSVFARVAPEQKLRLVDALQAQGHIVAMTGDGVNDAPALKQANLGIAMGQMGTEVAKEASDMVLTNDNFSTIEAAIEEGRGVFDNLVKFVTWTLPTNIGEGLVIMVAVFAGVTLPILPVQILWINMTTAVLLGLMLVFEPKEPGLMARPPRDPQTPILTGTLVFRIGVVGVLLLVGSFGLFQWELSNGRSLEVARTAAVNMFVFGEMFYVFNCRSLESSLWQIGWFSNRWLLIGVIMMIGLQLFFTYGPWMNQTFQSAPLNQAEWGLILGWGLVIYGIVGFEKRVVNGCPTNGKMLFMKILLAVDQSKDSKVAINLIGQFQWPAGSSMLLLHVDTIEDEKRVASTKSVKNEKSAVTRNVIPNIHTELRRVGKKLVSETLKVQSMVVTGIPGQEILTAIQRRKIDLVVLGSRGLSRVSGLLMGSVSEWVLNDAPCSVLIARPTARKSKSVSSLNVLLATDGSSDVEKAVKVLKEFVLPERSNVMLLHVIKKYLYETGQCINRQGMSWSAFSKIAKDWCGERGIDGVRLLKSTRDALSSLSFINIEECLVVGHEASGILKTARQQKADLVVVGSKGTTGLRRIFLGSVSHHVSRHAPCSVLVVRSLKKS